MPLPVAHGLFGATVALGIRKSSQSRQWRLFWIGFFLGVCPDFDYALNWLRIGGGGWHHGFTHSVLFALLLGTLTAVVLRERDLRSVVLFSAATVSHTLLDFMMTESRGVALWWPFTDRRYKLRLPNPIDYTWSNATLGETVVDLLRISLTELAIFGPILVIVLLVKRVLVKRRFAGGGAA